MIYLRTVSDFAGSTFMNKKGRIVIDFSNVTSRADVALKIGHILKETDSPGLKSGGFDALHAVVSDWVSENATEKTDVVFLNCNKISEIAEHLLTDVALVLSSSLMVGIAEAKIQNEEFDMYAGVSNINRYFILSRL